MRQSGDVEEHGISSGKVLLTGASGFIGGRLQGTLVERGLDVVSLRRRGSPPAKRGRSVEVEYDGGVISQYPLEGIDVTPAGLLLSLAGKHADCLAKDKCGVPAAGLAACAGPGCC